MLGHSRCCENRYWNFFERVRQRIGGVQDRDREAFSIKGQRDDGVMEVAASQEDHEVCVPDRANPWHSNASLFVRLCFRHVEGLYFAMGLHYGCPYEAQEWYHRANRSSKRVERGAPLFASQ